MGFLDPSQWSTLGHQVNAGTGLPTNSFQSQSAKDQNGNAATGLNEQDYASALQQALQQQSGTYGNQQALLTQLQQQAAGGGPNPAAVQLAQTTQANNAQASGLIGSQRGLNAGMGLKSILDTTANANQQAAGQAALMRQQQMLAAQQQEGGVLANQQAGNLGLYGSAGGLNQAQNSVNLQNLYAQQGLNQSTQGQNASLKSAAQGQNMGLAGYGAQAAGAGIGAAGTLGAAYLNSGAGAAAGAGAGAGGAAAGGAAGGDIGLLAAAAHGGKIPTKKELLKRKGGKVPGRPRVPYDAALNDTVHTRLTPGEEVIPLSIMRRPDAPQAAARFVANDIAKNGGPPQAYAEGGMPRSDPAAMARQLAQEDAMQRTLSTQHYAHALHQTGLTPEAMIVRHMALQRKGR